MSRIVEDYVLIPASYVCTNHGGEGNEYSGVDPTFTFDLKKLCEYFGDGFSSTLGDTLSMKVSAEDDPYSGTEEDITATFYNSLADIKIIDVTYSSSVYISEKTGKEIGYIIDSGKVPVLRFGGTLIPYLGTMNNRYAFECVVPEGDGMIALFTIATNDTSSTLTMTSMPTKGTLDTTISSSSTNSNAPTSKAVYDFVSANGGGVEFINVTVSEEGLTSEKTGAEILAILNSGKFPVLVVAESTYVPLIAKGDSTLMFGVTADVEGNGNGTIMELIIETTDSTIFETVPTPTKGTLETSITSSASTTNAPTAKAVWDLFNSIAIYDGTVE